MIHILFKMKFRIKTECEDGTYGYDCGHNCSGHCLNNSPSNKQTGHCDRDCSSGYTNVFCEESKIRVTKIEYIYEKALQNIDYPTNIFFVFDIQYSMLTWILWKWMWKPFATNNEVYNNIDGVYSAGF